MWPIFIYFAFFFSNLANNISRLFSGFEFSNGFLHNCRSLYHFSELQHMRNDNKRNLRRFISNKC